MFLFLVYNVFLLILWLRLLPQQNEKAFFNPYIMAALNLSLRIEKFLMHALWFLPSYALVLLVLVFALVFRGVMVAGTDTAWVEQIGLWQVAAVTRSQAQCIKFSFLSFALLLHRVWMLDLVLTLLRPERRQGRATGALASLAMPFSAFSPAVRGIALFFLGAGLGVSLLRVGELLPTTDKLLELPTGSFQIMATMAVSSFADVLNFAAQLVIGFIVVSFVGALARSQTAITLGNDGVDMIVGSVIKNPVRMGNFSFAPILFFIGISILHPVIITVWVQVLGKLSGE